MCVKYFRRHNKISVLRVYLCSATARCPDSLFNSRYNITVHYCYPIQNPPPGVPDIFPKTQLRVERIIVEPPCGPYPLPNPYQLAGIYGGLLENLPNLINCSNHNTCGQWCEDNPTCFCPDASPHWSVQTGQCVKIETDANGDTHYIPCWAFTSYELRCISLFQVCCDGNGGIDATFLGMDGDDVCTSGQVQDGCVLLCPKVEGNLHCCDENGGQQNNCPGGDQDPNTPVEERTGPCPDPVTGECP